MGALGRGDRKRALDSLDTLFREGEYLPLALTFLATQFRLAMAARDSGLKTSQQIQAQFHKQGIRIWRDRAEQVYQTVGAFPGEKLGRAIEKIFWADKALRDTRPDDRVVMEELVLSLTELAAIALSLACNPALVSRRGVLLDNAPASRAVDQRERGRQRIVRALGVFGCEQPAHRPDLVTKPRFAETIHHRLPLGLAHAFQR